jgi:hypothetical protein
MSLAVDSSARFTVQFKLQLAEYRHALHLHEKNADRYVWFAIAALSAAAAIFVQEMIAAHRGGLGLFGLAMVHREAWIKLVAIMAGVGLFAFAVNFLLDVGRFNEGYHGDALHKVTLSDEGVTHEVAGMHLFLPWRLIAEVDLLPDVWVFLYGRRGAIIVPRHALTAAADAESFSAFAQERFAASRAAV